MKRFFLFLSLLVIGATGFADTPPIEKRFDREGFIKPWLKQGAVGLEIGVFNGIFAYHVLYQHAPEKLYLVDPWEAYLKHSQEKMDDLYAQVCSCFEECDNVEILRERSEDVAGLFPDEYFDYVYIDGEHSYDAVTRDLNNYLSKVKVGGLLMGDDYGWTGIEPAVQEFLKKHKQECHMVGLGCGQYIIKRIK